jgi:hypothetical protein
MTNGELAEQKCKGGDQPTDQQHQAQGQDETKDRKLDVVGEAGSVPAIEALANRRHEGYQHQQAGAELEQSPHTLILLRSALLFLIDKNEHLTESEEPVIACVAKILRVTMMKMLVLTLGLGGFFLAGSLAQGQTAPATAPSDAATYVDENSTTPAPLKLSGIVGKVRGLGGEAIPRATISLFTDEGKVHAFLSSVVSDRDGKFRFDKVEHGLYRVVARVEGLCPANIPVKVEASLIMHRKLEITMRPKDLDTCSYGMAK